MTKNQKTNKNTVEKQKGQKGGFDVATTTTIGAMAGAAIGGLAGLALGSENGRTRLAYLKDKTMKATDAFIQNLEVEEIDTKKQLNKVADNTSEVVDETINKKVKSKTKK